MLAEQGKLADAIAQFEIVRAADELRPAEYRALAAWQMAQNQRAQYERNLIAAYEAEGERMLYARLNRLVHPWQVGGAQLPAELDPETPRVLVARKSSSTQAGSLVNSLRAASTASRSLCPPRNNA